jgi:cell division protease FtsH
MIMLDLLGAIAPAESRPHDVVFRIAIHEAGHAVVAHALSLGTVKAVSIVASGIAGGFTYVDHDGRAPTRKSMETFVVQSLAGRAAEEVVIGDAGTGSGGHASSDLASATLNLGCSTSVSAWVKA